MNNPTHSPLVSAQPGAGSLSRALTFWLLLVFMLWSGQAAEPERLSDSALAQIRALQAEKQSRSPVQRKLDSQIVFQLKQNRGIAIAPGLTRLHPDLKLEADGRVLVDLDATVTDGLLAQIQQSGGTVVSSFPQYRAIRAYVALDQIEGLAGLADVKFVRRTREAITHVGSVTSQGDVTHRADVARSTYGATGKNVKVGVLSDSINDLEYAQASGNLPDVTILPGQAGNGSGEGTAMLEIVHDLAPGAKLYFATAFNGEAGFANNILNLRSNGCDIIVDDVFYFNESPFQDGIIAQAVNAVTASGALYFSSAGNEGNLKDQTSGTWEGDFVDGGAAGQPVNIGGGRIHSFGPSPFNTIISSGYGVDLFWADPLGASENDYDLFVLDSTGQFVVASSLDLQDGTQDPYERLDYAGSGNRIVIVKASGAARYLHLATVRGELSLSTGGATKGHSAAAAAFSVAAVNAATSFPDAFSGGVANPVETFSADGPRRIFFNPDGTPITPGDFTGTGGVLRQKPDLAAADGVSTWYFGEFYGTSAAAPHAAAIAALMLSYDPTLSASAVRSVLTSTALDIEAPGTDNNSGAGLVMADRALQALPLRPVVVDDGAALVVESCPNNVLDVGETVTLSIALRNVGLTNTSDLVATLLNSGGITPLGGPQPYGSLAAKGSAVTRSFSFLVNGNCGGTNVVTLALQDGPNDLGSISFSFRLGIERIPLAQNFDSVIVPALPVGWTPFSSGAGSGWVSIDDSNYVAKSVFVPEPNGIGDKRLTSPVFPIITSTARLSFRHRFSQYTYYYNGGVLEISTNGGAFIDILAAGGSFVEGGYVSTLYTGYNNPLEGRLAWTGYSGGYYTTVVKLPALAAGRNVQLRWRFGSGTGLGGGEGWYIDDITLTDGFGCCTTVANDLVVRLTDDPDPVVLGGVLNYSLNVYNPGPASATDVFLTETLPANFTLQSFSLSQGFVPGPLANGGGTISLNLGNLGAGQSANVLLSGTVDALGFLTNRVAIAPAVPDAITNNNSATAVTTVVLPSLSIHDTGVLEGNSGTTNASFIVSVWPPPGRTVSVQFATADLLATAGGDYVPTNGTLVFPPGVTNRSIIVPVLGDLLNELDETFAVNLSNPTNALITVGLGVGTIVNDDALPALSVSDATLVVPAAGTSNANFNVRLSARSGQTVTAILSTSDGSAHGGIDYGALSSLSLSFNPGETNKLVTIPIKAHVSTKPVQTFFVNLSSVSNAKTGHNPGVASIITALPGQLDHFDWSVISSPQSNGVPFGVSITAMDAFNEKVSNFDGIVTLQGLQGTIGSPSLVVGISDSGNSAELNALRDTLTGLGHEVRSVGQGNWAGLDVVLGNPGSAFGPDQSEISGGVKYIKISDWGSDWTPNTWVPINHATSITLSLGEAHPITAGLPASWSSHGFWRYAGFSEEYVGWSTDGSLPNLASEVSLVNQSRVLVAKEISAGRAVYVGWNVYGPDASPEDLLLLGQALQWAATGAVGTKELVPITPTHPVAFSNGVWNGEVSVQLPATNVTLQAKDDSGHSGESLAFDVWPTAGQVTHYVWTSIPSPQSNGAPFNVTVTARDHFNEIAGDYAGPVAFTAEGVTGSRTNTLLDAPAYSDFSSGNLTVGYSFTPDKDLSVTHVRHYFGNVVRIWTDAGILLTSRVVQSTPGTWRETALISPLTLLAGNTYRITVSTGGGNYYWRYDMGAKFADGFIRQGYVSDGNVFPTNSSSFRWWLVDMKYTTEVTAPFAVAPVTSGNFVGGVWSGELALFQASARVTLRADDGLGRTGRSLPFSVAQAPGQVTRFSWNTIASPQTNDTPFTVTVTARDYLNSPVTNFTDTVAFSASAVVATRTTNLLGGLVHLYNSTSTPWTYGYSFTPATNLTVTHVRHYFGSKVSIWTDAGLLVAARVVVTTNGGWGETPLVTPVQLLAGQRYRVGVYSPGPLYYRDSPPPAFPDGTLDQVFSAAGDAFPTNAEPYSSFLVDLRYRVDTLGPVAVNPAASGNFIAGTWTGTVSLPLPGTNVTLRAEDNRGHSGSSNPFNVALQNDVSIKLTAGPDPVFVGQPLTYTITVSNIGPALATGVVVSNRFPPEVVFLMATPSQGSWIPASSAGAWVVGTVAGGSSASLNLVVQPAVSGWITNLATVTRNEADVLQGNNTASAVTVVRSPYTARVAVYGAPPNDSWNSDVRSKIEAAGLTAFGGSFGGVGEYLVRSGQPVPTLEELQAYDAVLVYSDYYFNNSTSLGNVLADYVDQGGGVVMAAFAFFVGGGNGISGRLVTEDYLPFSLGSSASGQNLGLLPELPAHPILQGLTRFDGGSSSYHNAPLFLTAGADSVARWSHGQPLVATKSSANGRVVGLNFYPPSSDVGSGFWSAATDGGRLMANALLWAAQHSNDLSVTVTRTPDSADVRSNLTFAVNIHNSGPAPATGVTLSNLLPASLYFISATTSQGAVSQIGQAMVYDAGTLAPGTSAMLTLVTRPNADGFITNEFRVARAEAEDYLANNSVSVVTRVFVPGAGGSFQITGLSSAGAVAIEVNGVTGDDRGGIALSPSKVFLSGDSSTARFNAADLSAGTALGVVHDSLVSDLKSERVFLLANGSSPLNSSGGTVTKLLELDGTTGVPNGSSITLSTPINLVNSGNVGLFSGYGQVVLHSGSRVYRIEVPSGQVADLGAMSSPSHQSSENWAYWGVAENFGGNTYLVYVQSSTAIVRTRVPTGVTTSLAAFSSLSDMASFSVSIARNRWYFHHEGGSQFRSGDETLGYANATFAVTPGAIALANDLVLTAVGSPSNAPAGTLVTYTLGVTNTGPALATGVVVSNIPPAGANLVSFSSAQATASLAGGVIVFEFGNLPSGTNATATVVVQAPAGGVLTNVALATRAELDAYTPNNRAEVQTVALVTPAVSIADAAVVEGHLGTTSLVFGVTLSATSAVPVSVGFATAGAGAIPGSDYISTNGTVSFPPGTTNQAISVIVLGDIQVEGNETFFVNLGSPVNALLGRSTAIGSIVNDDGLPGQLDHFFWSALAPVQYPGAFFPVNLTALDYFNNPVSNFTGTVVLTAQAGNGASLVLSPTNTGNFENGTWKGTLVIQQTGTNVNLKATGDLGHLGLSAAFNVMGGAVPPVILSPLRSGNQLQLFWSVGVLQSAGNVNGPYTNITGALSPYLIPTGGPRQFYRVQVQ